MANYSGASLDGVPPSVPIRAGLGAGGVVTAVYFNNRGNPAAAFGSLAAAAFFITIAVDRDIRGRTKFRASPNGLQVRW